MTDIPPIDRIFCAVDTHKLDDALLLADLLYALVDPRITFD